MKKTDQETGQATVARRDFLKTLGLASGAAAAVAATNATVASASEPRDSKKGSGYQETDHVRAYYDRARF